ncbi:MAG: hypothetical protein WBB76_12880 [Gaiellaceae bacterium]
MAGTVRAARRLGGRGALGVGGGAFAAGLAIGASLLFGALGALGAVLQPGRAFVLGAAALAVAAALSDLAGVRVRPQVRFQVPEPWRRTMSLPRALFLYGTLLGAGVTTFVPAATVWALLPLSVALGSVPAALAVGLSFAAGRWLPVLMLATRWDEGALAERPGGLRVLRMLAGVSVLLALIGGAARAATPVSSPAGDPSATGTDLTWQQPGVGGFLLRNGQATQLPGDDPALGGSLIAWHSGDTVTVAASDTLAPVVQTTLPGVEKLAVSTRWLVYRAKDSSGREQILARSLTDLTHATVVARPRAAGLLGRPSLSGDLVVFHVATPDGSWLTLVDLATGRRAVLRFSVRSVVSNPSLLGSTLLFVRASRCSQQLRIAPFGGNGQGRVLYELPPLAGQDAGHERHHTSQGEHLPCPHGPAPTTRILWTTALSTTTAYVTVLQPRRGGRTLPTLLAIPRA